MWIDPERPVITIYEDNAGNVYFAPWDSEMAVIVDSTVRGAVHDDCCYYLDSWDLSDAANHLTPVVSLKPRPGHDAIKVIARYLYDTGTLLIEGTEWGEPIAGAAGRIYLGL